MTGSLKLKIGQIVLVLIACRSCGMLSLEQSDPARKEEQEMRSATLGVQWCMMRQLGPGDEERDSGCTRIGRKNVNHST